MGEMNTHVIFVVDVRASFDQLDCQFEMPVTSSPNQWGPTILHTHDYYTERQDAHTILNRETFL